MNEFEEAYLRLRESEGRVYADEIVRALPFIYPSHPLSDEWKIRRKSVENLGSYLKHRTTQSILEVGCGNGWLIHYLNKALRVPCCGVDVNGKELAKAARVFKGDDLCFVCGDIMSPAFDPIRPEAIILAASGQYFKDLGALVTRLLGLLTGRGEIHIIDSPVYRATEVEDARARSAHYFRQHCMPQMSGFYHHHQWEEFSPFRYKLLHDPRSAASRLSGLFTTVSPFPWIRVTR